MTDHTHDLPPLWDGQAVQWPPWTDEGGFAGRGSLVFHVTDDQWACTGCGWIRDTDMRAVGTLMPDGATGFPRRRFLVRRCPGCRLDQVTDISTGEVWDLDETDYGDTGSWLDDMPVQDTLF
jgi:hypothetical protein